MTPVLLLIVLLTLNVIFFDDTLSGANQIALLLAAGTAGLIAIKLGYQWSSVRDKIVSTIGSAMPSILILLLIGSLAGTWMISGVVPVMIYYGLEAINPTLFLFSGVIVSVNSFGIFVELQDIYITGLVHVTALEHDFFHFDPIGHRLTGERTGKTYRLGDEVEVVVAAVNLDDRKIDLVLPKSDTSSTQKRKTKRKKSRKRKGS